MTPARLKVLKNFFLKKNYVSKYELVKFFFNIPSFMEVKKYIQKIDQSDDYYYKFYFKGINRPLFYPKEFPIHSINQVTLETFNKDNWHYYEIPETSVEQSDIVVDCGTAEGLFALEIENRCKKIYLIEPLNRFLKCLNMTFSESKNISILEYAISDKEYSSKIIDDGISSSLSTTKDKNHQTVKVTTLDKLFYEKGIKISYIKADLEGFDYKAIKGASKLIKKNKPKIAITTYHSPNHYKEIKSLLLDLVPSYNFTIKGIFAQSGCPVMLHAWID
jgi:FkbM family methyltransferase